MFKTHRSKHCRQSIRITCVAGSGRTQKRTLFMACKPIQVCLVPIHTQMKPKLPKVSDLHHSQLLATLLTITMETEIEIESSDRQCTTQMTRVGCTRIGLQIGVGAETSSFGSGRRRPSVQSHTPFLNIFAPYISQVEAI